ncbi:MAG: putative porin [Steroidobacteraceae bacterium]|jgi:hypothetical protein|nr:putative porin [Steroidobacteraceae bacterium]
MHTLRTAGVAILLASASLASEAAVSEQEVAELRQQVQALMARVEQLEARNQQLAAGAAPAARIEELEVRVTDVEAISQAQTERITQAAAAAKASDWAGRIKWRGDLRYRHETIEQERLITEAEDFKQTRQRIRARFGLEAAINDSLRAGFRIATGGALDPRSANVTLGDSNQRKEIRLDLAYVDWTIFEGTVLTAGKQAQPWFRAGSSLFYDNDVNPEGVALRWRGKSGVFANAWGYWLSESAIGADGNLFGAQVGWETAVGLTAAVSYHDYGALQGSSLTFAGFPAGNSVYLGDASCNVPAATLVNRCYVYDYDILGLSLQYDLKVAGLPLQLWAEYVENLDPEELNSGYSVGATLGKASSPGSWELGVLYQDVERDAQWAGILDSNLADGDTQGKGLRVRGSWAPVRNVAVNLTWFDNTLDYDTPSERDYERMQLDLNFRF